MSVKIMARVWANSQQKGGELLVMLALADFANDAGECWPSIPVLAQKSRLSDRQTRRVLHTLQASGELRRSQSNGGRNRRSHYFITATENPDKISVTELPCKNNTDTGDRETLTPMSGALNHHRTVNKSSGAKATESFSVAKQREVSRPDPASLAAFELFYQAYPRHVNRPAALKAWLRLNPDADLVAKIDHAVECRKSEGCLSSEPKFIPYPATWLSGRRWEDEPARGSALADNAPPAFTELADGFLELVADGARISRRDYERRWGSANMGGGNVGPETRA